jgi:hypothetical protein
MPRLRALTGGDLIRTFARFGFQEISQRGSHVKIRRVLVDGVRPLPYGVRQRSRGRGGGAV